MPVEGSRNHVATDGSLLEVAGRWGACGWSVVQREQCMGCTGTLDAGLDHEGRVDSLPLSPWKKCPTTAHVDRRNH